VAAGSVARTDAVVDKDGRRWTFDELGAVVSRAQRDDAAALETLERSFSARQRWWDYLGGDIAIEAEEALVEGSSTNEYERLAVRMTLKGTREELAGPCPTPLVRLAARRVALCKLDADLAYRSSAMTIAGNAVPPEAIQRWLDRADARYRKAIKTLADLQRLQLPVVQLNVGGQQVNIATDHLNLPGLAGAAEPTTLAAVAQAALAAPSPSVGAPKRACPRGGRTPVEEAAVALGDREPISPDPAGPPPSTPDPAATAERPTSPSGKPRDECGGSLAPPAASTASRGRIESHAGVPDEVPLLGPGGSGDEEARDAGAT
jgi:hypothetical protein